MRERLHRALASPHEVLVQTEDLDGLLQICLAVGMAALIERDDASVVRGPAPGCQVVRDLRQFHGPTGLLARLVEAPGHEMDVGQCRERTAQGLWIVRLLGRVAQDHRGVFVLLGVGARLGKVLRRPEEVHRTPQSGTPRALPDERQEGVRLGEQPVLGLVPVVEDQSRMPGDLQVIHQPVPGAFERVHPRRRRQVEVQQPRHRRVPLARWLFVALRAGTRVEAYEVVVAVAARGGGLQQRRVDEGFQEVFGVVDREVEDGCRGGQGDVGAVGQAQQAEGGPGLTPAGRSRVRRWP